MVRIIGLSYKLVTPNTPYCNRLKHLAAVDTTEHFKAPEKICHSWEVRTLGNSYR